MKKILKSRIFLVIITMLVSVGTTVCGAILYNANQVSYTPSDTTWNVSNVDEALNDLYSTANTKFTNFKSVVATAITDKGVATSETDSAETMASNIKSIVGENSISFVTKTISPFTATTDSNGFISRTYSASDLGVTKIVGLGSTSTEMINTNQIAYIHMGRIRISDDGNSATVDWSETYAGAPMKCSATLICIK